MSIEALLITLCINGFARWEESTFWKTYQNLRNLQEKYLRRSFCLVKPFLAVQLNFTYDSEVYDLKLYLETSVSSRTTAVELSCGNDQRVKAVGYFCKRAPLWILNATLPNNLLQLEVDLKELSNTGVKQGNLGAPCLLILLIYTKHKNSKMKFWTHPASSFPWVTPRTKI